MYFSKRVSSYLLILLTSGLLACGGGGGGGGGGVDSGGDSGGDGGGNTATPADRWVVSGNADGTMSLLRVNPVAGFATAVGYTPISAFSFRDMAFDAANDRLVALDSQGIHVIGADRDSGAVSLIDSATSSTSSNSHLALATDGGSVYVASGSGTTKFIDAYSIDAAGMLTALTPVALTVDPDYIQLDPTQSRLYLVSRSDDTIEIYDINTDGSLAAGPVSYATDEDPTALLFHPSADVAYLLRADNSSDSLEVLNVDATTGALSASGSSFDVDTNPIDLVLSDDGMHLYVLETSNDQVHHFGVDSSSGALSFVAAHNLSFTPTDLQLSQTGAELYISHSEEDLVSTLSVDGSDGTLEVMDWTRVFDSAQTVASISGNGALTPTPRFLLAPDTTGLSRYQIDANGALSLAEKSTANRRLINGEVEVDYLNGVLLAAGVDEFAQDWVAGYSFSTANGSAELATDFVGSFDTDSDFQRIEIGRSSRFAYVQDQGRFSSDPLFPGLTGSIYAYAYDATGDITPTPVDTQTTGEGPENMTLNPSGRYIYSINSFDDDIRWYEINEDDGTLSGGGTTQPGGNGSGEGRPIDLVFHPNGRYAYVSINDDSEVGRYVVDDDGSLDNISRFNTAPSNGGNDTEPGPMAVHPNGLYLIVGERSSDTNILVLNIDPNASYSLNFQQRVELSANPTWVEINPAGDRVYVRYTDETIEVFSFDAVTGTLTSTGQVEDAGDNGGFMGTLKLVAPLE